MPERNLPWKGLLWGLVALTLLLVSACSMTPSPVTATSAGPANYFVDCSAAADGDGTAASPWSQLSSVEHHGSFVPGDRILLRRGTSCSGRFMPEGSGTPGHPIVAGAYGKGASPLIRGDGTPDQTGAVELRNAHDWVIRDIAVSNFSSRGVDDTLRAGVLIVNDGGGLLSNILVTGMVVSSVTSSPAPATEDPHSYGGIAVVVKKSSASTRNSFHNVSLENNEISSVGRSGIVAWSGEFPNQFMTQIRVSGNHLESVEGDSILLMGVDGGAVTDNVSSRGGRLPDCPRCAHQHFNHASAGIWPTRSRHIEIRGNEVFGEGAAGGDGEGLDADEYSSDVVIEGNYVHDNAGGGILLCGSQYTDVRWNIFQHDETAEVTFACPEPIDGVRIFNNDFVLSPDRPVAVVRNARSPGGQPILFANNIVISPLGGSYAWPGDALITHNTFLAPSGAETPHDTAAGADPGLIAPGSGGTGIRSATGYALKAASPSQRSGRPIRHGGDRDFFGHTVDVAAPPRGASAG